MQGIVFRVLEACYVDAFGRDAWREVAAAAGACGPYTHSSTHPDAEFARLVTAMASAQRLGNQQALRWLGEQAIPHFHALAPDLFDRHRACWPFLRSLNDIIHPQVRARYPGVNVPDFEYPDATGDAQVIDYRSTRRMCALAEGLMLGAAAHFGESLAITQSHCMLEGDDRCRFELRFSP